MRTRRSYRNQHGAALIIGLLLVAVASLGAITSMRGTLLQDRMVSNQQNTIISQMAAEAGAGRFLDWVSDPLRHDDPATAWSRDRSAIPNGPTTNPIQFPPFGHFFILNNQGPDWNQNPVPVTIIGIARSGNEILAESAIDLRIRIGSLNPSSLRGPPAALTLGGNVVAFDSASSNNFSVRGGDNNAAVATDLNYPTSNDFVIDSIKKGRDDNYTGGGVTAPSIVSMDLGYPWSSAESLREFLNKAMEIPARQLFEPGLDRQNRPISESLSSSKLTGVTIVKGNASIGGNTSGTGLLIVTGKLELSGTPSYRGLVVVLGELEISGGGNGGITGATYVANVNQPTDSDWTFAGTGTKVSGGGGATLKYDLDAITNAIKDFPSMGGEDNGGTREPRVVSWGIK